MAKREDKDVNTWCGTPVRRRRHAQFLLRWLNLSIGCVPGRTTLSFDSLSRPTDHRFICELSLGLEGGHRATSACDTTTREGLPGQRGPLARRWVVASAEIRPLGWALVELAALCWVVVGGWGRGGEVPGEVGLRGGNSGKGESWNANIGSRVQNSWAGSKLDVKAPSWPRDEGGHCLAVGEVPREWYVYLCLYLLGHFDVLVAGSLASGSYISRHVRASPSPLSKVRFPRRAIVSVCSDSLGT